MKTINFLLTLSILAVISFGCQSETVAPKEPANANPELWGGNEGHERPNQQCGTSSFVNLQDAATGTTMGTLEVLNNDGELFILSDMNFGWLLQGVKIFAGNSIDLPKSGNGSIEVEEFPYQFAFSRPVDKTTFRVALNSLPSCYGITIYALAAQVNFFGQVTNTKPMWAAGTTVLNGKMFNYCNGVCVPNASDVGSSSN